MSATPTTLECPACGQPNGRPDDPEQGAIKCAACGARFRVPGLTPPTETNPGEDPAGTDGQADVTPSAPSQTPNPIPRGVVVPSSTASAVNMMARDPHTQTEVMGPAGGEAPASIAVASLVGLLGVLVGAGVWYGLAVALERELGVTALLVGVIVGTSVSWAGRRGLGTGAMAAAFALLALLVGRVAVRLVEGVDGGLQDVLQQIAQRTEPLQWGFAGMAAVLAFAVCLRKPKA